MTFKHNINDIQKITGLNYQYIRKCINSLDIFKKEVSRGNKNKIVISDNGLILFEQIAAYKQEGLSIPEVKQRFSGIQTSLKPDKKTHTTTNKLEQLYERLLSEKDIQIELLKNENKSLRDTILLLEGEGKAPLKETQENIVVSLESLVRNRIKNIFG